MPTSRRLLAKTVVAKLLADPENSQKWMQAAAAYLVEHKQVHNAGLFMNDIAHELLAQSGRLNAEVVSARPLSDTVLSELRDYLKRATGAADVNLQTNQNEALLGGFVARTADAEINKSVQYQLSQLRGIA